MFELVCYLDFVNLDRIIVEMCDFFKEIGEISKKELIERIAPHVETQPGDEKIGLKNVSNKSDEVGSSETILELFKSLSREEQNNIIYNIIYKEFEVVFNRDIGNREV